MKTENPLQWNLTNGSFEEEEQQQFILSMESQLKWDFKMSILIQVYCNLYLPTYLQSAVPLWELLKATWLIDAFAVAPSSVPPSYCCCLFDFNERSTDSRHLLTNSFSSQKKIEKWKFLECEILIWDLNYNVCAMGSTDTPGQEDTLERTKNWLKNVFCSRHEIRRCRTGSEILLNDAIVVGPPMGLKL